MEKDFRGYDLFHQKYQDDAQFKKIIDTYMATGQIRFFNDTEWDKIKSQNFVANFGEQEELRKLGVTSLYDMFRLGYNIGDCVGMCDRVSYSYNDISIVTGIFPLLKGTLNAENGGHRWLETPDSIIDTSLLLVIDKKLKDQLGYMEEERQTSFDLSRNPRYQARKEFATDPSINRGIGKH